MSVKLHNHLIIHILLEMIKVKTCKAAICSNHGNLFEKHYLLYWVLENSPPCFQAEKCRRQVSICTKLAERFVITPDKIYYAYFFQAYITNKFTVNFSVNIMQCIQTLPNYQDQLASTNYWRGQCKAEMGTLILPRYS